MKKRLLLALLSVQLCFMAGVAQELNVAQTKLRSDIEAFLKEEGFMPSIDTDGEIKFKREGVNYYIRVNENNKSPMFVSLYAPYSYPSDYSVEVFKQATIELNLYKGVKVLCFEKSVRYQAEMFLTDAESFKQVFYKLISQVATVHDAVAEECGNVLKAQKAN